MILADIESVTSGTSSAGAGSRTLASITVGGSGRILLFIVHDDNNIANSVSNVKFNTTETLTKLDDISGVNYAGLSIWYLVSPSATTADITFDIDGSLKSIQKAYVINNANLTAPFRDHQVVNSNNIAYGGASTFVGLTLTTFANDLVLDFTQIYGPSTAGIVPSGSQTEKYDTNGASGEGNASAIIATGFTQAMQEVWTDNIPFVYAALAIKDAATAAISPAYAYNQQ